jgi:ribosomal protein L32
MKLWIEESVCKACGHIGYPKTITKGSFLTEVILWLFFLLPGLIYSIWRLTSKEEVCPRCGNATMIPVDTPIGKQLLKENPPNDIKS